jgi:hypothetical protein
VRVWDFTRAEEAAERAAAARAARSVAAATTSSLKQRGRRRQCRLGDGKALGSDVPTGLALQAAALGGSPRSPSNNAVDREGEGSWGCSTSAAAKGRHGSAGDSHMAYGACSSFSPHSDARVHPTDLAAHPNSGPSTLQPPLPHSQALPSPQGWQVLGRGRGRVAGDPGVPSVPAASRSAAAGDSALNAGAGTGSRNEARHAGRSRHYHQMRNATCSGHQVQHSNNNRTAHTCSHQKHGVASGSCGTRDSLLTQAPQ